jgi:hypothetical protein
MKGTDAILRRLECQLDGLELVTGAAAEAALDRRAASGAWSARENLAHLARHHEVMLERLRRIREKDGSALAAYRAENDPEWGGWASRRLPEILERLHALRAELLATVRDLGEAGWRRQGSHSRLGTLSVAEWLEFFLDHEAHHLYVAMKRARGVD